MEEEELTIEEKASHYDLAIERAKKINIEHSKKGFKPSDDVLYIFPELKESEDERIREALIKITSDIDGGFPFEKYGILKKDALDWLKKKIKQKFDTNYLLSWSKTDEKMLQILENIVKDYWAKAEKEKDEIKMEELSNVSYFLKTIQKSPICWIKCSDGLPNKDGVYLVITDGLHNEVYDLARYDSIYGWHKASKIIYWMSIPQLNDKSIIKNNSNKNVMWKSINKDRPKFVVGDWTVSKLDGKVRQILGVHHDMYNNYYVIEDNEYDINEYDRLHHHWTIKDAKDGDVLSFNDGHGNDCIELIKSITDKKIEFWFCLTNSNRYEVFDGNLPYTNLASRKDATPATKEQRDLLFQKIKMAGYEWNVEKKELKKSTLQKAEHGKYYYCIKDYFYSDKKQASKGDVVQALRGLPIMGLENISEYFLPVNSIKYNFLPVNSIKYNYSIWSEEDENMLNDILMCGEHHCYLDVRNITWLKLLKERILIQNLIITDEQMEALEGLLELINPNSLHGRVLVDLIEQLKKLKG